MFIIYKHVTGLRVVNINIKIVLVLVYSFIIYHIN